MLMEETNFGAPKPTEAIFAAPSHRRRHLRSETYRTLVRIMSHCYENPELCEATQVDPPELESDNTSNLRQAVDEEIHEQIDSRDVESTQLEDLAILKASAIDENVGGSSGKNKDFSETQKIMDEMERMMMIEQNEDVMLGETTEGNWFSREEMLIDELEHIMQGNEVLVRESSVSPLSDTLEHNQSGSDNGKPSTNEEQLVDCQRIVLEESGDVGGRVSGTLFSLDNNVSGEISDEGEASEDNRSFVSSKVIDKLPERQPNDLELEKTSGTGGTTGSHPMIEDGEVEEGEQRSDTVSESFVFSLDKEAPNEVTEQSENSKDKSFLMKTNVSEEEHEMQREDMEIEKSLCNNDAIISPTHTIVDGDVEEGEICSDYGMIERSNNAISEDTMILEENINEMQILDQPTDRNQFPPNTRKKEEVEPASSVPYTVENANHGREIEYRQSIPIEAAHRPGILVQEKNMKSEKGDANNLMPEEGRNKQKDYAATDGVGSVAASHKNLFLRGQVLKENVTGNCEFSLEKKQDSGACKKKRGPPSEERKAKRKRKERKRRAEKNRQLGVKRLKLHPVTKPKPVSYCHHYLKGRCYEGDKCKFSHDTVPLTKSTPCCYFSRHSCMKGDDCPFDHQLSKYPCTSFASRGLCSKGDACMFSHKIPLKPESTPNTGRKPELKLSSLPGQSDSKKQLHNDSTSKQKADAISESIGIYSCKKSKGTETETILKPMVQAPVGINFLSFGKSSSVYSNNVEPGISSPKGHGGVKIRNKGDQILGMVEMANEISKRTSPATAAKGINFLSLGKASLEDSSRKKMLPSPSSFSSRVKLSQLDNPSLRMEATPSLMKDDNHKFSNGTNSVVKTVQNYNEILKETQTEPAPRGIDLFSSGKTSVDNCSSSNSKPICSSSNRKNDAVIASKDIKSAPIKHQNPASSGLHAAPISSGQSSNSLAFKIYRGTPNSAQKALLSTFAFAAKYESLMRMKQSSGAHTIGSEVNKENRNDSVSGHPQNGSMEASEILNFLSGLGGKSDQ